MDFCTSCRGTGATEEFPTHNVSQSSAFSSPDNQLGSGLDGAKGSRDVRADKREIPPRAIQHRKQQLIDLRDLPKGSRSAVLGLLKVCCDMEHQTPPPIGKMTDMTISQFESIHGLHAMLWIRDNRSVLIPNIDQLTRVKELVKNQQGEVATWFAGVERQLDEQSKVIQSAGHSVERRLSSLESRFNSMESRFNTLETLLREFIVAYRTT
ncbi:hypothetical protein DXG01_000384 [Tephrocybe rancida]|nr:hypothetical protein DXG01_000384 [Tephrocybe rancida]